jgi:transcription elongation factor Elf1
MRRRRTNRKRILQCPQCGSTNVVLSAGMITGQMYHCLKCDYMGALIFEVDVDEKGEPLP